jgi:hypothetical protein
VLTEERALEGVGLLLGMAEVRVEDLKQRFLANGAQVPELELSPTWGLRRVGGSG